MCSWLISFPLRFPHRSSRDTPGFASVGQEYTYAEHGFITTSYVFSNDQLGTLMTVPSSWNEMGATGEAPAERSDEIKVVNYFEEDKAVPLRSEAKR